MTLKEKFGEVKSPISSGLEKIADDYAIEFAEWIDKNHKSISLEIYSNKKKVLEIFKKEKGL